MPTTIEYNSDWYKLNSNSVSTLYEQNKCQLSKSNINEEFAERNGMLNSYYIGVMNLGKKRIQLFSCLCFYT